MSPKLRRMTAKQLMKILKQHGFDVIGQRGSHVHMENDGGVRITIPVHAGRIIGPGLLLSILRQAGIDPNTIR